ncbi:interferon alpha-inducible protein 27-like protein 2B isoform X1 [Lethenteron reissneri]|uniref:interferon alpha-inducible protein 27-like protein 2B isoform X2 n=1 Tax=Lethenteron reissneri TaxID=7753 RepID=UPI002AB7A415|nr:interferon alpha-inducible protein 27-like protein 2B isoform X2 [Lethenteron reissneri]XP_061403520.1 interferon alpha-inducible protein 27-like protein 2B isoform X1 [Lethenteron reissneri]
MTSQRIAVLFIAAILSVSITPAIAKEHEKSLVSSNTKLKEPAASTSAEEESTNWWKIGAMAAGGVGAVALAPVAIGAAGFGAGGIAAGGIAAKLMALAAAANGGGVAAGGIVAGLQAAGAAGLGSAAQAVVGIAGAAIAKVAVDVLEESIGNEEEEEEK